MLNSNYTLLRKKRSFFSLTDYNFYILLLFSLVDVFLYDVEGIDVLKIAFSYLVYTYVIVMFFIDERRGLLYLISFNLLTIGWGNYYHLENASLNYWGVRLGGFSLNIIVQFLFCILLIVRRKFTISYCSDSYTIFLFIYLVWIAIVGLVNVLLGDIYLDNYFDDMLALSPALFYFLFFKHLDLESLNKLFKYVFFISVISLLWAFLLKRKMEYGGSEFVVYNALYYLLPCGVFLMRKYLSTTCVILFIGIMGFLLITNSYFVSGKTIISFTLLFIWMLGYNRKMWGVNVLLVVLLLPLLHILMFFLSENLSNGTIAYKFTQVLLLFNSLNLTDIASDFSSIGNLVAELITLLTYFAQNPMYFIFGKGAGGGIPDLYGWFQPFAGDGGYKELDMLRNDYVRLHLAVYGVFIRGGIVILIMYIHLIWRLFVKRNVISFFAFIMMLFVFYSSKDYLLLTFLLLRITTLEKDASLLAK